MQAEWEKERLILVVPALWECYKRPGKSDLQPTFGRLIEALDSLGISRQVLTRAEQPLDIWIRDWGFVESWWFRFAPSYARGLYPKAEIRRARAALEKITGRQFTRVPL